MKYNALLSYIKLHKASRSKTLFNINGPKYGKYGIFTLEGIQYKESPFGMLH